VRRGRLSPANRQSVREWLERFNGCEAEKSALKRVTCPIDAG
jgi:hypothetical protein